MIRADLPVALAAALLVLAPLSAALAQDASAYSSTSTGLPINARPGECYGRVITPPQFKTTTEQVLRKAESERIEVTPERYDWAEETVMVKPASERIVEVKPAEYRWEEERVMVKPESERLEEVKATYRTVVETELVRPATTEWKRGRGLIEKVDNVTGDIMCLVEVPAEYKTYTKQVVDQPATTRRVMAPAEYTTVRRQVLVREAEVRKEMVEAQFQTVRVRKLVAPAREQRIVIPAEYQSITRQEKIADGRMEWRGVLCETNATPDTVYSLQRALRNANYDPGKIDGRLGAGTFNAVTRYQKDNGLAQGGITLEVLERLGVSAPR